MVNEFDLISRLTVNAHNQAEGLIRGVGDDCAVLAGTGNRDWLVTTDSLYEHIHFKREFTSFFDLGQKALSVNISDIAAMGGRPRFFLVSVGIPKQIHSAKIEEMYSGMNQVAEKLGAVLIGGDTCATAHDLSITVTVVGDVPHGRAIYRRGAKAGDGLYVTGTLGGSKMGLKALQEELRDRTYQGFIQKHLLPIPRLESANWLGATGCVSSMIDVSDGLLMDLGHLCDVNRVGMELYGIHVPLAEGLDDHASQFGWDPLTTALSSGEEYELAFTVSGFREPAFMNLLAAGLRTLPVNITRIGKVVTAPGIRVLDPNGHAMPMTESGYSHEFS